MMGAARVQPQISVVIPTHERASLLERSLMSLTTQTLAPSQFEVVVVDDGSADETASVCERLAAKLELRYLRIENSGISAAKNLGLFASAAPLILWFDDDDVGDPGLLEAHLEAHRRHPEENVAVLGYTTWAEELEVTPLMEFVTEVGMQLFSYPNLEDGQMLDHTHFWGGRSSCKRSFLAQHGSFDQGLPAMEDIELGFRLSRHGLRVLYVSSAKSYMVRSITFDEFAARCVKRGRALWLFDSRHSDSVVKRYCRVHEAIEMWPSRAPSLAAKMERVRELELRHAQEGLEEAALTELRGLYRWTFETLRARGIAEESEKAARPSAPMIRPSRANGRPASPVLIFGAPRSGTTYVNEILNAHPRVQITNEVRLFVWAHRALASVEDDQVVFMDRREVSEYLESTIPTLLRDYYRKRWPEAVVWGDKNPHYAAPENVGTLRTVADLFPGARFIHVLRDGRDVVASLIRKRHPDGDPWVSFEDAHHVWNSHVTAGHEFVEQAPAGRALEIRYEDLIGDDVGVARRMCEFLGIDFHPRIIEFCEGQQRDRTPVSGPTRDLSQGADQSEWETVLCPDGREDESLGLLRDNLVRFGYPV